MSILRYCISGLAATSAMLLVLITVIDVCGRYLFSTPLLGGDEMAAILLGIIIYSGLPIVSMRRAHVTVDFLTNSLPPRARFVQMAFSDLASGLIMAFVCWQLWLKGADLASMSARTLFRDIPLAPLTYGMSVLTGLTAAFHIVASGAALWSRSASSDR